MKRSFRRTGEPRSLRSGNAIAQAYNHPILPLQKRHDIQTQVMWALEDFHTRFGRESEGLWLSETAINPVNDRRARRKRSEIRHSQPWQVKETEKEGLLNGKPAPMENRFCLPVKRAERSPRSSTTTPSPKGSASGTISGMRTCCINSCWRLKKKEKSPLIHTATDGEIYGHHEPYGDMAFAALIKKCEAGGELTFTNYGAYLAANPAKEWAVLHDGEEKKDLPGRAPRCFPMVQGLRVLCRGKRFVEPKMADPLRASFDALAKRIDEIYISEASKMLGSEETARKVLNSFAPVASHLVPCMNSLHRIPPTKRRSRPWVPASRAKV